MVVNEASSEAHCGLTKREWMSTIILAGLLACPNTDGDLVTCAVRTADKLLNALDEHQAI